MHGPSSTLHSNAKEMCNWAITNMKRGTHEESTILDSSSYKILWNPWFEIGENRSIGLSWFLGNYKGEATVGHGGGDTGFNTNLVLLHEKSMAVVVLCNLSPAPVQKITNAALDILLGNEPASYKKSAIIPVCRELELKGIDNAAMMWDSLVANHPEEYDFNDQLLSGIYSAINLDRPKEAEKLAELYVNILEAETIEGLTSSFEHYAQEFHENKAIHAALRVFKESLK